MDVDSHRGIVVINKLLWGSHTLQGTSYFDIPLFEGQIDAYVVYKWLSLLEGYFSIQNFSNKKNILFSLLEFVPHVKDW